MLLRPLTSRGLSALAGRFLDTPLSKPLIKPFLRAGKIDLEDYLPEDYRCFNDCFTRRIRPELQGLYKEVFGATYETHFMPASRDYKEKSIRFCREAAKMGYVTVWDPSLKKITEN